MRVAGIVAEYNPFHNGHLYLLSKVREELGEDTAIVVIMSGAFVQRGIPAVTDRTARTCAALSCGVDVVLELPFTFATGSADRFAKGAIASLLASGVVTDLFFGAEHPELSDLTYLAKLDPEDDPAFRSKLSELQKEGQPYAGAWQEALIAYVQSLSGASMENDSPHLPDGASADLPDGASESLPAGAGHLSPEVIAEILRNPNNLLAISYLRELHRAGSGIVPHLVHRENSYHEETLKDSAFASATAIRKRISERYASLPKPEFIRSLSDLLPYLPDDMLAEMLAQWNGGTKPMGEDDLLEAALPVLRATDSAKLAATAHVGEQLAGYLRSTVRDLHYAPATSASSLWQNGASTRCFAYTRILRALASLVVGQTQEDLESLTEPKYLRLLGFSEKGRLVLKSMRKEASLPILSRASDAFHYARDPAFARMDALDRISHDFWTTRARGTFEEDFKREVIQYKRGKLYR